MAYLEFSKDGKTYAEADGRMSGVRYRDCCGEKQRAFISFSVCYGYRRTEFDDNVGLYLNCVAFGKRAEFINWLNEQNKAIVLDYGDRLWLYGSLSKKAYIGENGKTRNTLFCGLMDLRIISKADGSQQRVVESVVEENDDNEFDDL